ncbi:MAG: enoyl-CoA hydratase/isomerase family protein, partial [Woeseiaceae bacterium]
MSSPVSYTLDNNIGVITINFPPVNALSHAVRQGLHDAIAAAQVDASEAVVIVCDGRTFIAGADITEFGKPPQQPFLPDLLNEIEASAKPVLAAIHGTALGGGLETALAAHYRCALGTARVGLPEVNLGILPGAGGTQRLPRLAGVTAALDLMTSGAPIPAAKALELGIVDRLVEGDLRDAALAWARELADAGKGVRRSSEQVVPDFDPSVFASYRSTLAQRARGQIAPQHIVSCVQAATERSFAEGLKLE